MIKPHAHVPFRRFYEYFDIIKAERVNLEIYFDSISLDSLDDNAILNLRKALSYEPSLSIHAPFMDLSPAAVDTKIRAVTIERFNHIFDIAEVLKPKCIVFHSGYDKWKYSFKKDLWLEKSLITWNELLKRAEKLNIKIAIENIYEEDPEGLMMLVERVSSPYFGICFDTGHFNLFSKSSLEEWFSALGDKIFEFHLHDNNGSFDEHSAIFNGNFDFRRLFNLIDRKDYIFTIEARSVEDFFKSVKSFEELINLSKIW